MTKACVVNFLGNGLPKQKFYQLCFHDFFDGILGSETFACMNGRINYADETLTLNEIEFKFEKYFPNAKQYGHIMICSTTVDGDWYVPEPQKLADGITVLPGVYRAKGGKTRVAISTNSPNKPSESPTLGLNVNNFEILKPTAQSGDIEYDFDLEKIIRTGHLSDFEKKHLFEAIREHKEILLNPGQKLTTVKGVSHRIRTIDNDPIYTRSYRYPHQFKGDVAEQIQEMLDQGIIQDSKSPYNAPIWVVPKKKDASGIKKVRLVIDFRKLNEKTISDKYPIPLINDILDNLGRCEYFTTLDMKSGFHQIELDVRDRAKTAFSTESGHFEFTRMPFGLKNAPASFQRIMNHTLGDLVGRACLVYLDDIIVFGTSLEGHLKNLKKVFKRLSDCNIKVQLDKCEFMRRETEFLGHVISNGGVKANQDKIREILDWPLPKTLKQIRQFNGLASYYRKFIKDYAKIMRPIVRYTKKNVPIDVNDAGYLRAFEEIKRVIASDQILAYPDFKLPFILTTDASDFALGAVLSQIQGGVERPIAFASRTLTDEEVRYATNEKEALAIIWAVNKFKCYLYGAKFTLVTDHKPLTFIKSSEKNAKILRWRLELENFDYDVVYKEGRANVVADALSRKEVDPIELKTEPAELNLQSADSGESDAETVHSADTADEYFIHFSLRPLNGYRNQIIFRVGNIELEATEEPFPGFKRATISRPEFNNEIVTDFLRRYHNGKQSAILAPESLLQTIQESYRENFSQRGHFVMVGSIVEDVANEVRQDALISQEHERAHRGISEVEAQLKRAYFFPKMNAKIKAYINGCRVCHQHKYDRKPYNIKISPRPVTVKPFQRVHMDIFIINGENFLSLIDSFSKHLQMIPMKTKNLTDVTRALVKYIGNYRAPNIIVTDHETTFRSVQLRTLLEGFQCQLTYASSSESNGQIEKTHSTIIEIYNTNKGKFPGQNTKTIIRASVALYNETVHSATHYTPNEVIFNADNNTSRDEINAQADRIFNDVRANLHKTHEVQDRANENREDIPPIEEGEEVFLKPNIRTKTQPRGQPATANEINGKTFRTNNRTKRNLNKTKRKRK